MTLYPSATHDLVSFCYTWPCILLLHIIFVCIQLHFPDPSFILILTAIIHLKDGKPDYHQGSAFNISCEQPFLVQLRVGWGCLCWTRFALL